MIMIRNMASRGMERSCAAPVGTTPAGRELHRKSRTVMVRGKSIAERLTASPGHFECL